MLDWIDATKQLPPPKEGWEHSERVCVYYADATDVRDEVAPHYGFAYYHFNPPYKKSGEWIDWQYPHEGPTHWAFIDPPVVPEGAVG